MLKRFAPKSLYGRTILIVVLPIFIMQSVVTYVFFNRHWEEVTSSLAQSTASNFGLLTLEWEESKSPQDQALLIQKAREELEIDMSYVGGGMIPEEVEDSIFSALNRTIDRELDWSLDYPYWYNTTGFDDEVETRVQLEDGYLSFKVSRDRVVARNGHFFVIWLIVATLLLGYITLTFLRNQVRSITRLAAAADAFGRGQDVRGFKPAGASEVRKAGHAFIAMRARIRRFLDQRTEMLAGVSHDLKTPLTRMKLNLALQPDTPDITDLKADVAEMERLLTDYLVFAQGDADPFREDLRLKDIAMDLANGYKRQGLHLEVGMKDDLMVNAQRSSLVRAMTNLVDNAFKFGEMAQLSALQHPDEIVIMVDDDGPGMDEADHEEAVKAFGRLDQARNLNMPGSGLGLSIVRDVARAHGGRLDLGTSPLGGLRATISLPLS